MEKSTMRRSAILQLQKLSESEKKAIEQQLLQRLIHTTSWINARTIGITVSQDDEWNTTGIIKKAWEENKTIGVPKCYPSERKMNFFRLESFDELEVVFRRLQEPKPVCANRIDKQELDLMIVPGLLFDKAGFRLGFGGGYYDRFLNDYTGCTIGLTSSYFLTDTLPKEPHDQPVHAIVTEKEVIEAKGRKT